MITSRKIVWIVLGVVVAVAIVIVVTLALTPQETNPAFAAATNFMNATIKGEDAAAFGLLSNAMKEYVLANCTDGRVSECVKGYTPPAWGSAENAVFRRAAPDGAAWDVELIATYEHDKGASGVCIYARMENTTGDWRVASWAGFVSCGDPASRNMATNPDTPNRAP